ncbi:TonB family protein [Herbaspirillum sp. RV1423]|uniref:TonB family protein n=1 Tax=Herbaspirillum sp. RV1423 TaxID=1443993 RepID=UPI0004BA5BAC|nr:TonB family protein [Herbaspirillum sp. RV1423]
MITSPPLLFRFRETVAATPSLLALIALALLGVQQTVKLQRHADDTPVQIALVAQEPPPPTPPKPPQPEPPKPVVPPPQPTPKPTPQPVQKPAPAAPKDLPGPVTPSQTGTPELPAAPARATEPVPPAPVPAAAPIPPAPAVAAKPTTTSVEAEYVGKLRAHLNSIKRYPTGREASQQRPQGKVRIWFVLRRDGTVVDVGIDQSSNSMLLDEAARKTINRAGFSAFPDATWAGESAHRFTAELEFIPSAG